MNKLHVIIVALVLVIAIIVTLSSKNSSRKFYEKALDSNNIQIEFLEESLKESLKQIELLKDSIVYSEGMETIIIEEKIINKVQHENQLKYIANISTAKLDSTFADRFNRD